MSMGYHKTSCNLMTLFSNEKRSNVIMIIPMDVTLVGIVTDVKEVRAKAASPVI